MKQKIITTLWLLTLAGIAGIGISLVLIARSPDPVYEGALFADANKPFIDDLAYDGNPTGSGQPGTSASTQTPGAAGLILGLGSGETSALLPARSVAFAGNPAGLSVPPDARRVMGFERRTGNGNIVEQSAGYVLSSGTAQSVAEWITAQAIRQGFSLEPQDTPDTPDVSAPVTIVADDPPINRQFHRGEQLLILRTRNTGPTVRLALIFRYTMDTDPSPPSR